MTTEKMTQVIAQEKSINMTTKYETMHFKNLVVDKFDYCLNTCWDAEDNRKLILKDNLTNIQFVNYFGRYFSKKDDFLENNLSNISEIIEILREYINENFEKPKATVTVK